MKYSLRTRALALTMVAAFASLGAALAQNPPAAPPPSNKMENRVDHRLQFLTEKLSLTPAQQAQVKTILENDAAAGKAIHENASLSEEQKKAQWKSLKESSHSQINALLTPDQQTTFSELKEEHHHH